MHIRAAITALAARAVSRLPRADGSIVPDFITDNVLDVRVVCPPDSFLCPHGGRAFRDKRHDCAFTPCEFVAPATPAPATTLSRDQLRREASSTWFRREEFVVPRVRARDLVRGKRAAARVTASLRLKSQRALHWRASYKVATTVDVVVLAPAPERHCNKTVAHTSILEDALSTGADAALTPREPLRLVAAQSPWSRYAFFGWLARQQTPPAASVQAMLQVVQHDHSLEALVRTKPASWSLDEFFARVKPRVIVAVPTLVVVASDDNEPSRHHHDGGSAGADSTTHGSNATNWFARQSEALQCQVLAFLEHELWTLGHLESAPLAASSSVDSVVTAANASTPVAGSAALLLQSEQLNVTASVRFAAHYDGMSASLAVFLTPFAALVGHDDDVDTQRSMETEKTYTGDHSTAATPSSASLSTTSSATVWNFTLLACDEHTKRLQQAHSRIPLTVLDAHRTGNSSSSSGDNAVVSCWVYQPIAHALPVAAVHFIHRR